MMRWLLAHRNGFWLLLIISLAFNAGFGTTFGVRTYRRYCRGAAHDEGISCGSLHEKLNLTAEQVPQIRAAKEKLCEQINVLRRKLTAERGTLVKLLADSEPDRAAIKSQLGTIASLQQQVQQTVVDHLLKEKELLGPKQREAFNEIIRTRLCPHGAHDCESVSEPQGSHGGSGHADGND